MSRTAFAVLAFACLALGACGGSGPVRRVSDPAASIQQLTVRADGSWSVDLRINNYSTVPMRFDAVSLAVTVGGEAAGPLQGTPAISVGPESADVATLSMSPSAGARVRIADALAARRGIDYALHGTLTATTTDDDDARSFDIDRSSALNPVPGLPGVLR